MNHPDLAFGKEADKKELYTLISPDRPVLTVMMKASFVKRVKRTSLEIFSV
jgi:hypothetical protein